MHKLMECIILGEIGQKIVFDWSGEGDARELTINFNKRQIIGIVTLTAILLFVVLNYISALGVFTGPPPGDKPLRVISSIIVNSTGGVQSSFSRGSIAMVNVTLQHASYYYNEYYDSKPYNEYFYHYSDVWGSTAYNDSTRYMLMVQIEKSSTPVSLGFVQQYIDVDEVQSVGIGYAIPSDAPTGTYTVEVFVWDSWLPDGVILADNSGEVEATFTVTS